MNNKAQTLGLAIMFSLMIFIAGMLVINFLRSDIITARDNLNCGGSDLSDGTKLTCLMFSITTGYWILLILSASIGSMLARTTI